MKNYPLLDPRRDIVFKTIFTKDCEESHIARNNLISAFLGRTITHSTVLNNELPISDIRDKAARLDIHCVFDNGQHADLEMQMCNTQDSMEDRLAYYCCQLYTSQATKGETYSSLKDVYVILISNETVFPHRSEYLSAIHLRFPDGRIFNKKLNIFVLELSKLPDASTLSEDVQPVERWGLYFTSASNGEKQQLVKTLLEKDRGIQMANTVLYQVTQDDYDRALIFERNKILMDYNSDIESATNRGKAEGIELERKQALERITKAAQTMKQKGFTTDEIIEATGLTKGDVEKL